MPTPKYWRATVLKRFTPLLLGLAVLLVVAACGDDADSIGACASETCFAADDGLVLHGRFFGTGSTGVILTHMLGSDQGEWEEFAETLAARGFAAFTFDYRGHGRSPGARDVSLAASDLRAALRTLKTQLRSQQIFVVGASMGGTAALKVAASENVLGVVSISSPSSISGLSAVNDVARITAPKLFIAAEGDTPYVEDVRSLFERARDPKELQIVNGREHGTGLIEGSQGGEVRRMILDFIEANK
jgi:pimeloyl-ACP methyl ester carboxylesterase